MTESPQPLSDAVRTTLQGWAKALHRCDAVHLVVDGGACRLAGADGVWRGPDAELAAAPQQAAAVHAALQVPHVVGGEGLHRDAVARRLGPAVQLVRVPGANEAAAREALASACPPVVFELVAATLARGGNVLLAGPSALCQPLAWALLQRATRPALLQPADGGPTPCPPGALALGNVREAAAAGANVIAALAQTPAAVVAALGEGLGVLAHLEAQNVGRALMRLEAAVPPGRDATLAVLSGVDLVVGVGPAAPLQVAEVAEVVLTDHGYRPATLFARGPRLRGAGLEPRALPQNLDGLVEAGFDALVQQLRAICPAPGSAPVGAPHAHAAGEATGAPDPFDDDDEADQAWEARLAAAAAPAPTPVAAPSSTAPRSRPSAAPSPTRAAAIAPVGELHPGWELDQLPDEAVAEPAPPVAGPTQSIGAPGEAEEAAVLAASFGLAPPPRPSATAPALHVPVPPTLPEAKGLGVDVATGAKRR